MQREVTANLIPITASLREAMEQLNHGIGGVLFAVDSEGVMRGLLTDGDIRRALIGDKNLSSPVMESMNPDYRTGSVSDSHETNVARLNHTIRHLPILDEAGRPVSMIAWSDFWRLPVMQPTLGGNELAYVSDCIASNWVSSQGAYVTRFEEVFREHHGVEHALTVSNGTAALHLALVALGVGPGDEVIVPDLTFISPATMTLLSGATPVFADVDPVTWTLAPLDVEACITDRTRALIPVHLYGHPADMDPLLEIAKEHDLAVIEDCAEAFGALYKGRPVGSIGDIGTFSFFANKVITTGEGGMVTTNDDRLAAAMKKLRDHGMNPDRRYWHDVAGFNYRLTNMQAALGLAQMEQAEKFFNHRAAIVKAYDKGLRNIPGITLPPRKSWVRNIFWLYSIQVNDPFPLSRDELAVQLNAEGIDTRPLFPPLHGQPPFAHLPRREYPIANRLAAHGLSLPSSNSISVEDVTQVAERIRSFSEGAGQPQLSGLSS